MENDIYSLNKNFSIENRRFAHTILKFAFPNVYQQIFNFLFGFELLKSDLIERKGNTSKIPRKIKEYFISRGWEFERQFNISKALNGVTYESYIYQIDFFHKETKIALDWEWERKDSHLNENLENLKVLHEFKLINLGIIFTRTEEAIIEIPKPILGNYGNSTTNLNKLIEKLNLGISGTCPILGIAIGNRQL